MVLLNRVLVVPYRQLYNYFEDRQYVYLVVEYCQGGELQSYLQARGEPLDEAEASHLLRQIVDGMIYLHSHCILHRDLSLSNLLLTQDLHVVCGRRVALLINTASIET